MASHVVKITVAVLIFCLSCLPPRPVGSSILEYDEGFVQRRMVVGSRPPICVNKCFSCRPCMATLVIPPHQTKRYTRAAEQEDGGYYLLSWKCRCGNKLFDP